jgi:tetratricopeptide (TPR) repeat protein
MPTIRLIRSGVNDLDTESARVRHFMESLSDQPAPPVRSAQPVSRTQPSPGELPSPIAPPLPPGVLELARIHLQRGGELATRGALFSARAEFVEVLRIYTRAQDSRHDSRQRSEALARAMRAIEEADDLCPRGSQLDADLQLAAIIESHQTSLLKNQPLDDMLPSTARNEYYAFAAGQLVFAMQGMKEAAESLYGLGRIHAALAEHPDQGTTPAKINSLRAIVFHQAALMIDPDHFRSANELGVLLARHGQLEAARQALTLSVSLAPRAESLNNLAAVQQRLGLIELAAQTRSLQQQLDRSSNDPLPADLPFRYVNRQQFEQAGGQLVAPTPGVPQEEPAAELDAARQSKQSSPGWWQFWK